METRTYCIYAIIIRDDLLVMKEGDIFSLKCTTLTFGLLMPDVPFFKSSKILAVIDKVMSSKRHLIINFRTPKIT